MLVLKPKTFLSQDAIYSESISKDRNKKIKNIFWEGI